MKLFQKLVAGATLAALTITSSYAITKIEAIDQKNPDTIVKTAVNNTFDLLKTYKGNLSSSNTALRNQVKDYVLPYFNTKYVGARILGQAYKTAKPAELEAFQTAIENYMLNAYIDGLGFYNGQEVKFNPSRAVSDQFTTSSVTVLDKSPIKVDFRLLKSKEGTYRIVDFTAEGISITQTKLVEWQPILKAKGIAGLTKYINENSTNILDKYKNLVK